MKLTLTNIKKMKTNSTPLQKRVINYIVDEWSNYDDKKHIFTDVLYHGCVRCDMMKITIEYSNKIYNFEHGYETYIFCAAVNNEFDKTHPDELKDFIFLVGECYLKDSNQTPLGALSDYMAENWDKIKHLSRYDILEKFYDQLD